MQIKTTMQHHLTSARMALIQRQNIMLFDEDVEKREALYTIGGNKLVQKATVRNTTKAP